MKHSFSASDTKLKRARKHLAELENEIAAFLATKPVRFETEENKREGRTVGFKFILHMAPTPQWLGAIVGDVIHNLRAALDLTACEIVRAAGQSDAGVFFPFAKSAEELDFMIKKRNFDRAGPDAISILQGLKPYINGNIALRAIHDLDIHDKHRALIPGAIGASGPIIQLWEDDGTHNPRVIGDPTAATMTRLVFPAEAGGLVAKEIIPTLHELVQLTEGIVETFRALANR